MYSSAPHRVNIIAGPEPERDATHAQADTPEMRRLAALFNAHRDALCTADDQEAAQDSALDDTTAAAAQEQAEAQQQPPEQPQPEHPAVAAGAAALLRAESAAADADASANASSTGTSATASDADAATQPEAGVADLPFAPAWQKPDQGSSGGNGSGQNGGNNGSHSNPAPAQAGRSSGSVPAQAARSGGSVPAPAAAPANLIAALRAATTAPGFTASRTAQPPAVSATTPPASQPGQAAHPAQPRHARVDAAPAALGIGALNPNAQQTPLIESIVSSVADFCANPAVFSSSPWQLTVPLDPALLPGTQLTLVLSHFALTLRFATTEPASHDLILQHADALRQNLEALPTLHQDTPRAIEIVVT